MIGCVKRYHQLRDIMPIMDYRPWYKQSEFHKADFDIRLHPWANRVGKTTMGAAECVSAGMGMHKHIPYPRPPFLIWVISTTYKQQEDSIVPAFEGDSTHPRMLPKGVRLNRQRMEYLLPSGTIIRLKSSEAGREAFQGAGPVIIWFDEDHPAPVVKECLSRLGPTRRWIVWTMTAVDGLTYAYHKFYVPWLEENTRGRQHKRFYCSVASMDEAPHLNQAEVEQICSLYPPGSKEYQVRRHGGFIDIAGGSFFAEDALVRLGAQTRPGMSHVVPDADDRPGGEGRPAFQVVKGVSSTIFSPKGSSSGPTISPDYYGPSITIYYQPEPGEHFSLGMDVAEGKLSDPGDEDSERDYNSGVIYSRDRNRVAAILRSQQDPHTFALWSYLLSWYYNWAWLCPEVNNNGVAVIGVLRGTVVVPGYEWLRPYPHIFIREVGMDAYQGDVNPDLLGFKTTVATRPKLLSDGYDLVCKTDFLTHDVMMVEEMKTFAYNKQGKAQHACGFHDDMIFGLFLALQAHLQCPLEAAVRIEEQAGGVLNLPFDITRIHGPEGADWHEEYEDLEIEVLV